jgi:hypothetical protein
MELQRISSLDKFLNTIVQENEQDQTAASETDPNDSLRILIRWWKKYLSLKKIQQNFLKIADSVHRVLQMTHSLSLPIEQPQQRSGRLLTFQEAQELLLTNESQMSLRAFLAVLPHDPSLKTRNKQVKSVKFLISALIIQQFPTEILQENGFPDEGPEARRCIQDAKTLVFALRRLCHSVQLTFREFR